MVKKSILSCLIVLLLILSASAIFANDLGLQGEGKSGGKEETEETEEAGGKEGAVDGADFSDFIKDYTPVTKEQMAVAKKGTAGITSTIGLISAWLINLMVAGVSLQTLIDLAGIAIPVLGGFLSGGVTGPSVRNNVNSYGQGNLGTGGFAPVGGVSQANNTGQSGSMGQRLSQHQFVSNEFVKSLRKSQQTDSTQLTIYIRLRFIFFVLFVVSIMLFTSSIIFGFSGNVGAFVLDLLTKLTGAMG